MKSGRTGKTSLDLSTFMATPFMATFFSAALFCTVAMTALSGCSKTQHPSGQNSAAVATAPLLQSVKTEVLDVSKPSALSNSRVNSASLTDSPARTQAVSVSIVADKQALLSQEFLYGADLQYSSFYDSGMDLYNQSLAIGHIPARFRVVGSELQLIADNRRLYPSEVNHPEQLLSRFQILSETETTFTLSAADSSVYLASLFQGTHSDTHGGLSAPVGARPLDRWVRSFEFAPQGNYLLQQTSIVLADGKESVAEFMEAIFPRSTLNPGESFEKFEMNPDSPTGGDSGVLERFRLLAGENIFRGEKKLAFGQHFDLSKTAANSTGTIDWYVTPNITDEQMVPVKLAVEGWNRYFKRFKGIERDVVLFKGRLPEGIHLGDPRFNVINWDSRLIAGAAYETQATDPETGKQSHSLIYMPAAWLQIGFDYWKGGQYSDAPVTSTSALGGALMKASRLACVNDLRAASETAISGRLSADEVKEFGQRLLKGTLFHEVGHALGLGHNFKGSLSFDRTKPGSAFSTSIMDYNDYEIERGAFPELLSSDGPELEYDRQALSAIYNKSADIASTDAVVPACNDAEADSEDGGVDPLCVRYDVEKDPTQSVITAWERLTLATRTSDVTLAQALARVPELVLTDAAVAAVKTQADLKALVSTLGKSLRGSMAFYLSGGKASLSRVVRTNVKSLLQFEEGILPEGYKEAEIRDREFGGVQKALGLRALPEAVKNALAGAEKSSLDALSKTPYLKGLAADEGTKLVASLAATLHKTVMAVETDEAAGLPKIRAAILTALARHKKVPFYFGKLEGADKSLDIEASLVGILGDTVTATGEGSASLTKVERLAAATTLATYWGRPQGDAAISAVKAALLKARSAASDNDSRELVESLLSALKPVKDAGEE
jgi:hypothetical protein